MLTRPAPSRPRPRPYGLKASYPKVKVKAKNRTNKAYNAGKTLISYVQLFAFIK